MEKIWTLIFSALTSHYKKLRGVVKAIVHRLDNDDDKLVVMPDDLSMTDDEIEIAVLL